MIELEWKEEDGGVMKASHDHFHFERHIGGLFIASDDRGDIRDYETFVSFEDAKVLAAFLAEELDWDEFPYPRSGNGWKLVSDRRYNDFR